MCAIDLKFGFSFIKKKRRTDLRKTWSVRV